jgi:organic radical activating enzyme
VNELKSLSFYVALETNGTICTNIKFDWVCVSPKENSIWKLKIGDELKVVYPQNKFNLKNLEKLNFKFFFLQPKYDALKRVNLVKTLDYCKLNENWFPSFQIHKVLRIS